MRNALWYHDNYYIQRDRADKLEVIVDEQDAVINEWRLKFQEEQTNRYSAEKEVAVQRRTAVLGWSTAGGIAAVTAISVIVLIVIK